MDLNYLPLLVVPDLRKYPNTCVGTLCKENAKSTIQTTGSKVAYHTLVTNCIFGGSKGYPPANQRLKSVRLSHTVLSYY